jgi:hypothetical protein
MSIGIIIIRLNGVAMDALLGFNVINQPWRLFENMNRQALKEGAVGSLAECADALPLPDANWTRRTGTFLQAWSNAEHLRVWQEGFLGLTVRAQRSSGHFIQVKPKLPKTVLDVKASLPVGSGSLQGIWHDGDTNKWTFRLIGVAASLAFKLSDIEFGMMFCNLVAGGRVTFVLDAGVLVQRVYDAKGGMTEEKRTQTRAFSPSPTNDIVTDAQKEYVIAREVFAGLDFCKPRLKPGLKSLSIRHDPPLTY